MVCGAIDWGKIACEWRLGNGHELDLPRTRIGDMDLDSRQ